MNIIIPLGGVVKDLEIRLFNAKPLIKVEGKEIIRWLIDSIKLRKSMSL